MKILVVDDEPLARERLLRLLSRLRPDDELLQAGGGREALALLETHEPDLLLLDIRMPEVDGIEVAALAAQRAAPPAVVFCTAYDEYALQALQHQAVAYLLKPVREAALEQALASASRVNRVQLASLRDTGDAEAVHAGAARTTVSSTTHRGFESEPVASIRCFIAGQKYVSAISPQRELLLPDTLKDLEEEFADSFVRVHRNALVALRYVQRLEKTEDGQWQAVLADVAVTPAVSRRLLPAVKQRLAQR